MSGTGPRRDRSPPYWPEPRGTRGEGLPPHRASSSAMSSIVGSPPGSMEPRIGRDDVIKGTDDDAIISKLSAVDLGYLDDPFVKYFVKRPSRRPPLINRGSYLRTASLDNLTEQFIKSAAGPPPSPPIEHAFPTSTPSFSGVETVKPTTSLATAPSPSLSPSSLSTSAVASVGPSTFPVNKQIVSFGCGSDTRYFNLKKNGLSVHKYFEIDFPESTAKKAVMIKKNKDFTDVIADPDLKLGLGGTELYAKDYCLLSGDLREFTETIVPKLKAHGFDTSLPTMFLSECVLIYIQPQDSDRIVEWVGANMDASLFVLYEQINPTDAFGAMMLRNLHARQIELPGIHAYPSLKSQEERFLSRGWLAAKAVSMNTLHDSIPETELRRISNLEIFDEVEEWQLLAGHYCVAWAIQARQGPPEREDERAQLINLLSNAVSLHTIK